MSFKKTKVVMLPTNEKAPICKGYSKLFISDTNYKDKQYQHLYFLSDDEIKEGDWFVGFADGSISPFVRQADKSTVDINNWQLNTKGTSSNKKIIATTDKNLMWLDRSEKNPELARPNGLWKCLPQPSEGFIQKFVESYNSGNQISEVDVEYNHLLTTFGIDEESLKINPKDNTITIKKAKDTWSRDEVINLLQQFNNDKSGAFDCTKWIEENL